MSDEDSLNYHYPKHGGGVSLEQYTQDARAFADNLKWETTSEVELRDGTTGTRYRTPGGLRGIVDQFGRLITFWYR